MKRTESSPLQQVALQTKSRIQKILDPAVHVRLHLSQSIRSAKFINFPTLV